MVLEMFLVDVVLWLFLRFAEVLEMFLHMVPGLCAILELFLIHDTVVEVFLDIVVCLAGVL